MDGVNLVVSAYSAKGAYFGYMIKSEYEDECYEYVRRPFLEWRAAFKKWVEQQGDCIFSQWETDEEPNAQAVFEEWLIEHYPDVASEPPESDEAVPDEEERHRNSRIRQEFWDWMEAKEDGYASLYKEINPRPERSHPVRFPPGTLGYSIREALIATIKDLETAVNIRDSFINIYGRVDESLLYPPTTTHATLPQHPLIAFFKKFVAGFRPTKSALINENQAPIKTTEPSPMSGYGVYTEVYEDFDCYADFMEELRHLGNGSILEGMRLSRSAVALCSKQEPVENQLSENI
jgi:hypothetical protein